MPKTVAILLAAGESRRMGELKALLPWQGASLLEHQVEALHQGGAHLVVVVLGHRADELRPLLEGREGVVTVLNPQYQEGKTTSIKAGVRAAAEHDPDTLLLLNVDQPRSAATIRFLLDQHRAGGMLITLPTHQGRGGHPLVLDSSLLDELLSIDEETQGMRAVVERHREQTRKVEVDHPEVLWDLNTPQQYRQVLGG
jgi:molybdenum cofactor cytidylyltransferase